MITIENDEKEYLRWIRANQTGFVINAAKQQTGNPYLMLHKANCQHIAPGSGNMNYTTTAYKKVCSLSKQELLDWANKTSINFKECSTCKP